MYGLKEKKLTAQDVILSCQVARQELEESQDEEKRRVNVDSAKKRSVLYGMDYEGFRQMVLGANLFTIKSKEIAEFSNGKDTRGNQIFNPTLSTFNNVVDLSMRNKEDVEYFNLLIADQLSQTELRAKGFRDFRKNFDKFYKNDLDDMSSQTVYMFLKAQDEQNLKNIFSLEFEASYFMKMMKVFDYVLKYAIYPNKNIEELNFIVDFLNALTKIKEFTFMVPGFLSKKEKLDLNQMIPLRQKIIEVFDENQIPENFEKIEKFYISQNV